MDAVGLVLEAQVVDRAPDPSFQIGTTSDDEQSGLMMSVSLGKRRFPTNRSGADERRAPLSAEPSLATRARS